MQRASDKAWLAAKRYQNSPVRLWATVDKDRGNWVILKLVHQALSPCSQSKHQPLATQPTAIRMQITRPHLLNTHQQPGWISFAKQKKPLTWLKNGCSSNTSHQCTISVPKLHGFPSSPSFIVSQFHFLHICQYETGFNGGHLCHGNIADCVKHFFMLQIWPKSL